MPAIRLRRTASVSTKQLQHHEPACTSRSLHPSIRHFTLTLIPDEDHRLSVFVSPSLVPSAKSRLQFKRHSVNTMRIAAVKNPFDVCNLRKPFLQIVEILHNCINAEIIGFFVFIIDSPLDGTALTCAFFHQLCNASTVQAIAFSPPYANVTKETMRHNETPYGHTLELRQNKTHRK